MFSIEMVNIMGQEGGECAVMLWKRGEMGPGAPASRYLK